MFYRLRRRDGASDPFSAGSLVLRDGTRVALAARDVGVETLETWTSPTTDVRYPSRWRITVPCARLVVDVTPRVSQQEWTRPVQYWEGSVALRGTTDRGRVEGEGYVELVGYAGLRRTPRIDQR